mmetsp:Transcript_25258/g.58628  ORF Transcript_25258/g.58628 Transcript_25258/m.58628 type:complete len:214 (-) Transcript_25258:33-674(-)
MASKLMKMARPIGFFACSHSQAYFQQLSISMYLASLTSISKVPSSVTTSSVSFSLRTQSKPPWKKIELMFSAILFFHSPAGPHVRDAFFSSEAFAPPMEINRWHFSSLLFSFTKSSDPTKAKPGKADRPSDRGHSGGPLPVFVGPGFPLFLPSWSNISCFIPGSSLLPPSMLCAWVQQEHDSKTRTATDTAECLQTMSGLHKYLAVGYVLTLQ